MSNITTLLFDLGGVLIELSDIDDLMATPPSERGIISREWLLNPVVRNFEAGHCSEREFAERMIADFRLNLTTDNFLDKFREWPRRVFPGAELLLEKLSKQYKLACLSNTNLFLFEHFLIKQAIIANFDYSFFSHETGLIKPEPEAFHNVMNQLSLKPFEIMFFDDNQTNVDVATAIGMVAKRVNSPIDVLRELTQADLFMPD